MALMRLTRNFISIVCKKPICDTNKLAVKPMQRQFSLGQLKMDKNKQNLDNIRVDGLSRIALVVNGKYKSLKDVPVFLPYGQVYKARDKFRIKASIASGVFVTILMIYLIRKNQGDKRVEEYKVLIEQEARIQQK